MKMIFFKSILNVGILIIFPLLLYVIYVAYEKNMKEEENLIILDISLFISLLFALFFNEITIYNFNIFISLIPLLLSFINKRNIVSILMSIILIDNFNSLLDINIIYIIIFFILFNIINYIYIRKYKNYFIQFNILIFYITVFFIYMNISTNNIYDLILYYLIYYIFCLIIIFIIKKSFEILFLFSNIKDFEHEKQIKLSLFKITHEVKNPIAVVKGYLDMFDVDNKEKSIKYISIIKQEINRTLNLLTDFMEFTKININKEFIDLELLLEDVKDTVIPFFNTKKVKYCFDIEDDIIITVDYNRIKQVIINIIKNACEACNENGYVSCVCFKNKKQLFIIVKDNGVGMSKETLENIKTPFYTTKLNGTGLGVCLSREIIESHGGSINYVSKINKGTTVKIVLPI